MRIERTDFDVADGRRAADMQSGSIIHLAGGAENAGVLGSPIASRLNAWVEVEFDSDATRFVHHCVPLGSFTQILRGEPSHHAGPR
jgi:hypothetical protein